MSRVSLDKLYQSWREAPKSTSFGYMVNDGGVYGVLLVTSRAGRQNNKGLWLVAMVLATLRKWWWRNRHLILNRRYDIYFDTRGMWSCLRCSPSPYSFSCPRSDWAVFDLNSHENVYRHWMERIRKILTSTLQLLFWVDWSKEALRYNSNALKLIDNQMSHLYLIKWQWMISLLNLLNK